MQDADCSESDNVAHPEEPPLLPYLCYTTRSGQKISILLDLTSQVTCITSEAVKKFDKFKVKRLGVTQDKIQTLNGISPKQSRNLIEVNLDDINDVSNMKIRALQVKEIAPISNYATASMFTGNLKKMKGAQRVTYFS